jgi:putative glutamine amidotransferase
MRPLIGIPPSLDARGRWRPGRNYHYLHDAYARAVAESGALPVYLPIQPGADGLLRRLDGLLLPGGADLPSGGRLPDGVVLELVAESQLDFDTRLLEAALTRELPVLAICYGMQLLSLLCGGSLHHHLPSERPDGGCHRLPERDGRHALVIAPGSRLAQALGDAPPSVNSLHQQGVSDAGRLAVSARAEDGLIEAVEDPAAPFCLGVQWHPEKLEGPQRERLFAAFTAACGSR